MRRLRSIAAAFVALSAVACATIDSSTRTVDFDADQGSVFAACRRALEAEGYTITTAVEDAGRLTATKVVPLRAGEHAALTALIVLAVIHQVEMVESYPAGAPMEVTVSVDDAGAGRSRVRARFERSKMFRVDDSIYRKFFDDVHRALLAERRKR